MENVQRGALFYFECLMLWLFSKNHLCTDIRDTTTGFFFRAHSMGKDIATEFVPGFFNRVN